MEHAKSSPELSENHRRGVATTLTLLDELLCRVEEWAEGHERHGALYHERNDLNAAQRKQLLKKAGYLRSRLQDAQRDMGLTGVARGTIKHIRIAQHVGWPLDPERGAMHYLPGNAGSKHLGFHSWSPVRVLGTVPVEADGSAHFTVPADKAIYFQALDADHVEVLRMRSMVSLKAGETRGCRGCHESQAKAPALMPSAPLALQRPADVPKPPTWGADRLLGYEWLVQPILDKHCVRCHDSEKPDGGIDLSKTRAADGLLQSYRTLFGVLPGGRKPGRRLVSVSNRFDGADVTRPKQFGSHLSPFITALRDALHRKEVKLSPADWLSLVTWVDANAPYYDAFVNKRPPGGGPPRRDVPPRPLPPVATR